MDFEEDGSGAGGYAKEMSAEWHAAARAMLTKQLEEIDIVITTALIPGMFLYVDFFYEKKHRKKTNFISNIFLPPNTQKRTQGTHFGHQRNDIQNETRQRDGGPGSREWRKHRNHYSRSEHHHHQRGDVSGLHGSGIAAEQHQLEPVCE